VSGHLDAPAALPTLHRTHWIGGWLDPQSRSLILFLLYRFSYLEIVHWIGKVRHG